LTNPKVSIIVPVYNTEKYLIKCLDSLIFQTLNEIEIICVNDGSQDNSLEILYDYAREDKRIRVINQANSGVSNAKNNAIDIAIGEFITFVDSDDWIEKNHCEVLYKTIKENEADVVMFSYYREYENKCLIKHVFDEDIIFNIDKSKDLYRMHIGLIGTELSEPENAGKICSSCTKLYKASIIKENNIKNVDLNIIGTYEDGLFNLHYYKFVKKAVYINQPLYHYRKTNDDSITSVYRPNLTRQWNNLYDIFYQYINENKLGEDFKKALLNRISIDLIALGLNVEFSNKTIIKKIKEVKAIISNKRYREAVRKLEIRYMPIHWKVFFFSAKINFSSAVYMLLIVMNTMRRRV
jgi:glycosyltransferase involved in cell wall biosynthesis